MPKQCSVSTQETLLAIIKEGKLVLLLYAPDFIPPIWMHPTLKLIWVKTIKVIFVTYERSTALLDGPRRKSSESDWLTLCLQPTQASVRHWVRRAHESQIGNEPNGYLEVYASVSVCVGTHTDTHTYMYVFHKQIFGLIFGHLLKYQALVQLK